MKQFTLKLVAGLMFVMLAMTAQASLKVKTSYLFVIHAKQGVVDKQAGQYALHLTQPILSYFSDRPVRKAGKLTSAEFVSLWDTGKDSLAEDNPNAALLGGIEYIQGKKDVTHFIVLDKPSINKKTGQLTFAIRPLHRGDVISVGQYKHMMLFIDDFMISQSHCGDFCD